MNTLFRLLLLSVLTLGWGPAGVLRADPPAPGWGRVLLLTNERIIEGEIERVGEQYRIRRDLGETWITADRTLGLCADRDDAYALLKGRANLNDPDEYLRLARWCHVQGMPERALENVRTAVKLRPQHKESQRLLASLERAALQPAPSAAGPAETAEPVAMPEVGSQSLGLFVTRVQPILMNACANCHASTRAGTFKLNRTYDGATLARRSMQQNLASVLAQVNLQEPQASPLLIKSVTAHGDGTEAPLRGRQAAAFRSLEDWVQVTLASNPHLARDGSGAGPDPRTPTTAPAARPPAVTQPEPVTSRPATATRPSPAPAGDEAGKFASGRTAPAPEAPKAPPKAVDPFDPVLFNQGSAPEPHKEPKAPGAGDQK